MVTKSLEIRIATAMKIMKMRRGEERTARPLSPPLVYRFSHGSRGGRHPWDTLNVLALSLRSESEIIVDGYCGVRM